MKEFISTHEEYKALIMENKEKVLAYVIDNDVFLGDILSTRAYNILRIQKLYRMSDIIFLSRDDLAHLDMMDKGVLDEIWMFIKNYLRKNKTAILECLAIKTETEVRGKKDAGLAVSLAPKETEPLEQVTEREASLSSEKENTESNSEASVEPTTAHVQQLLQDEAFKEKVREFAKAKEIQIADMHMSARLYGCLRRGQIEFLHEAIPYYPEGIMILRSLGMKSADEFRSLIESFVINFYNEIQRFIKDGVVVQEEALCEDEALYEDKDPSELSLLELLKHPVYKESA